MKRLNKILAAALIPLAIAGCYRNDNFRDTAKKSKEKAYEAHLLKIKQGDSLSYYLAKEGDPISLDSYVNKVKEMNKDNKEAFVNYDGGQIRTGKLLIIPDLNRDGEVAGRKYYSYRK